MGNRVYRDKYGDYEQEKRVIKVREGTKWFYKELGIQATGKEEIWLKEYMDNLRECVKRKTIKGESIYPAAQPFYKSRKEAEKEPKDESGRLLDIFQKMPKGGLLHVHSAAALSTDLFFELLKEWVERGKAEPEGYPEILVVTNCGKNKAQYKNGTLLFAYQVPASVKMEMVPLKDKLADNDFMSWLRHKLSVSDDKTMQKKDIWKRFNHIFARIDNLFTNRTFYVLYHMAFFMECGEDNIDYVELRSGFQEFTNPGNGNDAGQAIWTYADRHPTYHVDRHLYYKDLIGEIDPQRPNIEFLEALIEAMDMAQKEKFIPESFSFRVILNARRDLDPQNKEELQKLSKKVDAAIFIKENWPEEVYRNLVIGFDFVSEEDRGKKTEEYVEKIIYQPVGTGYQHPDWEADERLRLQHIDFFLHDGESCWKTDDNMIEALLVSRHRIGHGFNLNLFREAADEVTSYTEGEDKEPLVEPVLEICPISNQLLRYYQDVRNHSAYELMRNGICCVIANDDPLLLGNGGLTYDYWEAYLGMELPWEAVKASVYITYLYRHYGYGPGEHFHYDEAMGEFTEKWNRFVGEMYQKYVGA